jgi:hypothetical protein
MDLVFLDVIHTLILVILTQLRDNCVNKREGMW